jgi:hypothetical protein
MLAPLRSEDFTVRVACGGMWSAAVMAPGAHSRCRKMDLHEREEIFQMRSKR